VGGGGGGGGGGRGGKRSRTVCHRCFDLCVGEGDGRLAQRGYGGQLTRAACTPVTVDWSNARVIRASHKVESHLARRPREVGKAGVWVDPLTGGRVYRLVRPQRVTRAVGRRQRVVLLFDLRERPQRGRRHAALRRFAVATTAITGILLSLIAHLRALADTAGTTSWPQPSSAVCVSAAVVVWLRLPTV